MRFIFANKKLQQLYTDRIGVTRYPPGVMDAFFETVFVIQSARDENDLRTIKSLRFEKLLSIEDYH